MRIYLILIPLVCMAVGLVGCYEPREGCLDAAAANFDLEADKPCDDCCTYPSLKILLQHRVVTPDTIYRFGLKDSVYYDALGQPFKIKDLRFYMSNIHLVRSDGSEVLLEDKIELTLPLTGGGTETVEAEDNFLLVNPSLSQSFAIGALKAEGPFNRIRFNLGIAEPANKALPEEMPENHPLALQSNFPMYFSADSGYIYNKILLLRGITTADTIPTTLSIGTLPFLRQFELDLPGLFDPDKGFNSRVTIRVDYGRWFREIDARNDSPALLIQKIVSGLEGAFEVVEVREE